jgi:signal transduction histidine kinase
VSTTLSTALSVVLAVVAASYAVSGAALLVRRTAVPAAALMLLTGVVGVLGIVLLATGGTGSTGDGTLGRTVGMSAATLLAPLSLLAYPRLRWRHPVDFLALAVVGGSGVVGTVYGGRAVSVDVVGAMALIQGGALLAHTWWRIETSRDRERRALVWMAFAVPFAGLVCFVTSFSAEGVDDRTLPVIGMTALALVGPALYVGATLPEIVDVRGLVVGVVVTTFAVLTVLSVFVLELSLLEALGASELNTGALGLLAGIAAFAFQPTRVALRGVVDQILFGQRPDPLGAASAVAGRIGDDPVDALRAIREALVLPYAALEVDGVVEASSGTSTTHQRALDLEGVGRLLVGLRPGDLTFSPGDEQVLRLTVPLLAQTLRARALAAEVVASRGRTIAAIEEERRRLRRDLHDGLGPRLSGIAFTSDAARNLVRSDPTGAEGMLAQLRADTTVAIEEIRRMVYAMRPPALDELGLVPALRQQAIGLRTEGGQPISVTIDSPELPPLPAAVEVAAYRIVTEALTNVARHSASTKAAVRLHTDGSALSLEVVDEGRSGSWRPGVGMSSMRERATELGGTLVAGPGAHGGTVTAVLPLRA